MPGVRDAEERQLLSPAACAWVEKADQEPWVSLRFAASLHWNVAGGKSHIRAGARAPVPVQSRVQVRPQALVG